MPSQHFGLRCMLTDWSADLLLEETEIFVKHFRISSFSPVLSVSSASPLRRASSRGEGRGGEGRGRGIFTANMHIPSLTILPLPEGVVTSRHQLEPLTNSGVYLAQDGHHQLIRIHTMTMDKLYKRVTWSSLCAAATVLRSHDRHVTHR